MLKSKVLVAVIVFAVLLTAVLAWLMRGDEPIKQQSGVLSVVVSQQLSNTYNRQQSASGTVFESGKAAATNDAERINPATMQERDPAWANKTEVDIGDVLVKVPWQRGTVSPTVICGANTCEINGRLPDRDFDKKVALTYFKGTGFAEDLGRVNAMPDEVIIDPDTKAFTIYLSRVRK